MAKTFLKQNPHPGLFIVIEGIDYTGKETQSKFLTRRLKNQKTKVAYFDFPQYGQRSAVLAEDYLAGEYGEATKIDPVVVSLFYALDRFAASNKIKQALSKGRVVVSNRFSASSLGHQGGKFRSLKDKKIYWNWLLNFEHKILHIPNPDVSFILMIPLEVSLKLKKQRNKSKFSSATKIKVVVDQHERDSQHLKNARQSYLQLARTYPRQYKIIDCYDKQNHSILPIKVIHEKIWQELSKNKKFRKLSK